MKQSTLSRFFVAAGALTAVTLSSAGKITVEAEDCRNDGAVQALEAEYVPARGVVAVNINLCDKIDLTDKQNRSSVRILFDFAPPFAMQADRNGDNRVDKNDECADTNDAVVQVVAGRSFGGPGKLVLTDTPAGTRLSYEATLQELGIPPGTRQVIVSSDAVINKNAGAAVKRWPKRGAGSACNDVSWTVAMGISLE